MAAILLASLLLAACGGGGGGGAGAGAGGGGGGTSVTLVSIAITPANPALLAGTTLQLNARGTYSDGATQDISGSVGWSSSATQVATVAPGGILSAVAAGSATITATVGTISTSTAVTVVSAPQATLTFIHEFQGDRQTNGPLLQASDGNFYATTRAGGANQCRGGSLCGTLFRLTPGGNETLLYSFGASATDAFSPTGPLIQGSDGALYGVTTAGGTHGAGTVFRITLAGAYSVLHSFGGSPTDGVVPFGGLVQASDGNFYGVTASGGGNNCVQVPPQGGGNCGTVFRITPAGVATILYSFGTSPTDGVTPNGPLLQASDGNFYGTTVNGGANACNSPNTCGTVFRMTPAGVMTVLYSFGTSPTDGIAPQGPLIQGSDGAFYGTTVSGGGGRCGHLFGCGTVFRITPAGNVTIIYAFATSDTAPRSDGYYPTPFLIQARDGNFYGTTGSGGATQADLTGTVFRLTPSRIKTTLYSFGPLSTQPSNPVGGLIQASDGTFYGQTFYNGAIGGGTVFRVVVQ